MVPNILMLCGALVWLAGEIFGVIRDGRKHKGIDTTSGWVWWLEHKWPLVRIVVAGAVALLFSHLVFHVP
jgi:hypothetical protein